MSVVAAGSVAAYVIGAVSAPLLSRLYTPAEFGVFAAITAVTSVLLAVSSLRYELAVPLPAQEATAAAVVRLSLALTVVTSACIGVVIWATRPLVVARFGTEAIPNLLWTIPLVMLLTGGYQAVSSWPIRQRDFGLVSRINVDQALLQVVAHVVLGWMGAGAPGLILGGAAGRTAGFFRITQRMSTEAPGWWRPSAGASLRSVASRYRRFPTMSMWAALLISAAIHAPALLLASLFGPHLAGLFAVATRLVGAPMTVVGRAVGQVFTGEAAELARNEPQRLRGLFVRVTGWMLALSVAPFVLLAMFAPAVFAIVLGAEWREAGELVRLAAPMFLLQLATAPPAQILAILERQGLEVTFAAVRLTAICIGFAAVRHFGLGGHVGVGVYSAVMSASYVMFWVMCFRATRSGRRGSAAPA